MNDLVPNAAPRIPRLVAPARSGGRRRHQAGQPQLPDNQGSPAISRTAARWKGSGDGKPCLDARDAALRSATR